MIQDWQALYEQHASDLEDFWGRRQTAPRFERTFTLFGRPARLASNDPRVLNALDHSLPLYSSAPLTDHVPFSIRLVVRAAPVEPGPPPPNLFAYNQYTGHGDWLAIQMGGWGHCQIDLAAGRASGVLVPSLAERPEMVSRYLLNTLFNNLLTSAGFGMMHCTGLLRGDHALLLMAPHNSGKSTTALRLVMAGYRLLSDSQIYVAPDAEPLELLGFPVGRAKLRQDMVPSFPQLQPLLEAEQVRDETKFSLDLRRYDPHLVHETAVRPRQVSLCLLSRNGARRSTWERASRPAVMNAVMKNSIFFDTPAAWARNLQPIARCVTRADWFHLAIGHDPDDLVATVDQGMAEALA